MRGCLCLLRVGVARGPWQLRLHWVDFRLGWWFLIRSLLSLISIIDRSWIPLTIAGRLLILGELLPTFMPIWLRLVIVLASFDRLIEDSLVGNSLLGRQRVRIDLKVTNVRYVWIWYRHWSTSISYLLLGISHLVVSVLILPKRLRWNKLWEILTLLHHVLLLLFVDPLTRCHHVLVGCPQRLTRQFIQLVEIEVWYLTVIRSGLPGLILLLLLDRFQ